MRNDDPLLRLKDFVAWVRIRRSVVQDAWVDEKTLEYVAQGIERFLEGKNPWPKQQGNKPKRDKMWECYYLTNFADRNSPHLPQHSEEGGAFYIVGERLKISPKTVESHTRKARKLMDTMEGSLEYASWLSQYRYKGGNVVIYPADHPLSIAERERREASGVGNRYIKSERKRKDVIISGEISPKLPDTQK